MFWLLITRAALVAFSYLVLRGENLSYLDQPLPVHPPRPPSDAMRNILAMLSGLSGEAQGRGRERVRKVREIIDRLGAQRSYESAFRSFQSAELRGEWVLAPEHDPNRRILYLHGGAFFAGSPLSHRPITDRLARLTGAAVFALDYRLMPEHRRIDGIEDCRRAYRWILENGPEGLSKASFVVVAGDSAGGNLTLSLLSWIRDEGIRMPDAGVAMSPATDAVLDAPSLRAHIATDPMLGPAFGKLVKLPRILLLWSSWFTARMLPSDPRISPVRGSLAGLPPVLVQVSDSEMLLDDARRYVAKAQAAESPVVLQSWPNMLHVWQIFAPELEEAEEAFAKIAEFLAGLEGAGAAEQAA
jgi:monoterpene epsilon-lactone hydrolase